jgi:catechol 2,3-dioxygenase-like lactoylglutathione lyase family enzyme
MRLQLALNVPDIDAAVSYYSNLFGVDPHKRRDGYANFAIDQPALKLVLFENPGADEHLNHLGVEVFEEEEVDQARQRLDAAGILGQVESETQCCHATQDKVWSRQHDGLSWEWYRIVDDTPDSAGDALGKTCCTGSGMMDNMGASCQAEA